MNILSKICNWYFTRKALPYWCILALDSTLVFFTGLGVYYLQYGGYEVLTHFWPLVRGLAVCLVFFLFSFIGFHTFRSVMRYSSFVDLHRLSYSTALSCIAICVMHQVEVHSGLGDHIIFPGALSCLLIFLISTALMWGTRVVVKTLHDTYLTSSNTQNVFIYGCLSGGIALAKSIRNNSDGLYHLSGFITFDETLDGSWLLGVPVYYETEDIVDKMLEKHVTEILVSPIQSERFTNRSSLIDSLIKAKIKILMMPAIEEWDGKSNLSHKQLREVQIEDLLPRQKIEVDMNAIGNMLRDRRILITGAAGSIGSEIARQVAKFQPSELILIDQAETPMHDVRCYMEANHNNLHCQTIVSSITDAEHMEVIFKDFKPEYVFHAAAFKHVPMMEDNPGQAVRNNIYGTRVIADLAVKYGTRKFVMISTDKAVNPTNVMGCSKRICEIYCQSLNAHQQVTQFITTRFGNVLGSNGSVIPIFREQIKNGGPVKVTHPDIIRYFMLIPEACRLVLEAGTMGHGGEIFVFDMGDPVRIVDLANRMIALSGAKDVDIVFTGLRDGEKLYEELLATKEDTTATVHPKIMVAKVREYPYDLALKNEVELFELSKSFDDMAIVKKMKEIVPEFKSRHSKYEILDK